METVHKFILFDNEKPLSVFASLSDAMYQAEADGLLNSSSKLSIELRSAPAKTRIWGYDCDIADWVEES